MRLVRWQPVGAPERARDMAEVTALVLDPALDTALQGVDRAGVMAPAAAKAGLEDCRALSYPGTQERVPDREEGPVMARAPGADSMFRHGPTRMVQKRFWPSLMKS